MSEMPEQLRPSDDDSKGQTAEPENISGALRTQRAIIDSELFWFGRIMNSDDRHLIADAPPQPRPASAEIDKDSPGTYTVIYDHQTGFTVIDT